MIIRDHFKLPDKKRHAQRVANRLEWLTIAALISIVVVMYLTMGSSQAMKTAWIEDMLSLLPPVLYLITAAVVRRGASRRFPYGFHRVVTVGFAGASLALVSFGGMLLYNSISSLLKQEHPTIGLISIFGHDVWHGWVMIVALIYSAIPPVILGRLKIKRAKALHDKTLFADASMNKADWMTAVAGVLGIVGVGFGLWWADAAAAAFISFDILKDGVVHLSNALGDICDQRPTTVEHHKPEEAMERMARRALLELSWVVDADVRLREEGHLVTGEAHFVPIDNDDPIGRTREANDAVNNSHWRMHDITSMPVAAIERTNGDADGE